METVSDLSRVGMPPTMFGTLGSVTTTCAVSDLTSRRARATTGLRLNGPATGCTTIDRPYGAPSYGPVRYTLPLKLYGEPEPAATTAVPIWLAGVHVPALACASGHSFTLGMVPTRPGGRTFLIPATYWLPCGRTRLSVNVELAPPCAGSEEVL